MSEIVEALTDSILHAGEVLLREHGACPRPQVHILAEDMDQPYVGFVTCRPFYRGADAANALAGLGLLPSVLMATRLVVAWEDCDLRTALEMPGEFFATGITVLDARFQEHTLRWYPYDVEWGDPSPYGIPTVVPGWRTPARYENVPLLAPIEALLDVWRTFRDDDIQQTATELQDAGYELTMIKR
ncbi:hypothetical protein ACFZBU_27470 [Embleya sp. NPDC008237]|uniref:hypothetical protein n=1 Tax=Embleya sp. NPDC008237 TaxID=3363978 RepID=UPI0036E886FA